MTTDTQSAVCETDEDGVIDHDWEWIRDWMGDGDVPCGLLDISHYVCRRCGDEKAGDPPMDDFEDHDPREYREEELLPWV